MDSVIIALGLENCGLPDKLGKTLLRFLGGCRIQPLLTKWTLFHPPFLGVVIGGARGGWRIPLIFRLSAQLPNINSVRQRCIAYETQGKSYLSANWA